MEQIPHKKQLLQDHGADSSQITVISGPGAQSSKKQPFQYHPSTEDVKDIIAIKKAFPESFDHVDREGTPKDGSFANHHSSN